MESVDYLVVGAGMSGLGFTAWLRAEAAARGRPLPELVVLEADDEPGGYCKTVERDGFVWDYSGHFFHFKHPEIETWLRARMDGEVRTVAKRSAIRVAGTEVDFPFQKNIHQLPHDEFLRCLVDLYFRDEESFGAAPGSFKEMLYRRFGRGIAELFLVPYNQKLYATDLDRLDRDAMGRFFPHADVADIVRNMRSADNASYNATFTYPARGAMEYVRALLREVPATQLALGERLVGVDLRRQVAWTTRRELGYRRLVSSMPLPRLLAACGLEHDAGAFTWNKVLVFNLGFDRKGRDGLHWMYFPDPATVFYRVGWYDNIMGGDRMSLYVEIGADRDAELDVAGLRGRVLDDLAREGVVTDQTLVAEHAVVLDPAYVHVTQASLAEHARVRRTLEAAGVYSVGRYGGWTYCSIEDNLVETRDLARTLGPLL
ncbi:MAG: NAD(P)-binding protein [Kofleriaceae bacterium]|nr:NAD(P)-binding protein [Kofleriaceae bacterium]MCL4226907.1 NAD(P)-binding protein [Myxococcales bacterium]